MSEEIIAKLDKALSYAYEGVQREPAGALAHPYLVPAGPYNELWDWDAFFMSIAMLSRDKTQVHWLKHWSLNLIENAAEDGKVPGCITPAGGDPRLNHIKPFLAQGIYLSAEELDDYTWVAPHWDTVKRICLYRQNNLWNSEYDLGVWFDSMESGADNNIAALDYPDGSVIASDANALIYREYVCMARIAEKLELTEDAKYFADRAATVKANTDKHLWCEEDQIYYNIDSKTGEFIRCVSYSSFVPLWANMAPQKEGQESIKRYLINPDHMWSDYGIRSLSKAEQRYNNVNMIKPHSNWQGPVWPIANYIYMHTLLNYGFNDKAYELSLIQSELVLKDIEQSGGMHENYDAETGEPLAAPNFISWNILVHNMPREASSVYNPLALF